MAMEDQVGDYIRLNPANSRNLALEEGTTISLEGDELFIVDSTDNTKKLKFDVSGLTTATTVTVAAKDSGLTQGGRRNVVDTGGVFATPIVLTAADSGKFYLLDDAAGLDFTLPALSAAEVGITYSFFVVTTVTSNSYRFTAQSGDLMRGHVLISDFDAAYTAPQILAAEADQSNDLILTISNAASGGTSGGWMDVTAITATGWFWRGNLLGDGTIVTVFS